MALNFRRRIRLARGVHLNLSKSGASLSAGVRGATVNVSSRGLRTTLSAPGTGVSYTKAVPWVLPAARVANIRNQDLVAALRAMAQVQDPSIKDDEPITLTVTLPPMRPGTEIVQPVVRPEPQGGGFLFFILIFLPMFILWIRILRAL